jgi:hypothetical protein
MHWWNESLAIGQNYVAAKARICVRRLPELLEIVSITGVLLQCEWKTTNLKKIIKKLTNYTICIHTMLTMSC